MALEPGSELERADKLRMVWIAPDEEGDGRVGEATSEEGGERGGNVAVRAALGGAGVGGVGRGKAQFGALREIGNSVRPPCPRQQ